MSGVMQHLFRRGRHSRKPMAERQRIEIGAFDPLLLALTGKRMRVYFEGELVEHCIVADEIKGLIVQIEQPARLVLGTTNLATVTRRGVVGIEIEDAS